MALVEDCPGRRPDRGKIHVAGSMIMLSRTPMVAGTTPKVGQNTHGILAGTLGCTNEKIETSVEDGVAGRGNQRG